MLSHARHHRESYSDWSSPAITILITNVRVELVCIQNTSHVDAYVM